MTFQEARKYLLSEAKKRKLDTEILASETRELSVESFEGQLSQITQATQGGIGVRVVVNGKTGYASSEERTPEALDWVLNEAKENAELQSKTGGFIPMGQTLGSKDLIGEGLSAPIEEKAAKAIELEKQLRQDTRTKQVPYTRYSENETELSLSSTQGADGGYRNGYSYLMSSLIMAQGENLKQAYDFQLEKEFHALEPGKTALKMIHDTSRLLGAKPLKTGRYTAYVEPKAFAQLMGIFFFMLSGKTVMEGKSRLADKLGQKIASEQVTIIDDPMLEHGKGNRPFDSEGTPAKTLRVIENGVLKSFLHNSETAHALNQSNTGHAARSYSSTLGVAPSNFYLQPGNGIKQTDGIIVTELMGVHAGANPISGDISVQAFGLKVETGEIAYAVDNFAISCNLLDMLMNVKALGEKLEWSPFAGMTGAPMVEITDVSFGGA
jgi:PmbA protein